MDDAVGALAIFKEIVEKESEKEIAKRKWTFKSL